MCHALLSQGNRRGAMMGTLSSNHPDIAEFIDAKRTAGALTNFNLSVQVPDALVEAAVADRDWCLTFPPAHGGSDAYDNSERPNSGSSARRHISAAALWRRIIDAAYDTAEPGVLFVDRINRSNNLGYREHITTTNPCGEVPLPPYGACNLGSINLAAQVGSPYSANARLDLDAIGQLARVAVRFLDNVIDLSPFPLPEQADEARATRRIGLGITGLADALIMLGLRYDSEAGRDAARAVMTRIRDEAYAASVPVRAGIARHGIRNSHLLSIAPAGSIRIPANNLSSGIEPVFAAKASRAVRSAGTATNIYTVVDHACALWAGGGKRSQGLPPAFVSAEAVAPEDHLLMAAALQPLVDNAISKTINVATGVTREAFGDLYRRAHALGLKGCTVFRANPVRGSVLSALPLDPDAVHCCVPEREGD